MSFLSADGRLEDRITQGKSKDSQCSLESDGSLRIGVNFKYYIIVLKYFF